MEIWQTPQVLVGEKGHIWENQLRNWWVYENWRDQLHSIWKVWVDAPKLHALILKMKWPMSHFGSIGLFVPNFHTQLSSQNLVVFHHIFSDAAQGFEKKWMARSCGYLTLCCGPLGRWWIGWSANPQDFFSRASQTPRIDAANTLDTWKVPWNIIELPSWNDLYMPKSSRIHCHWKTVKLW